MELDFGLTRKMIKLFQEYDFKVLLVTKSDIVKRDIELLKRLNAVVTITITTHDPVIAAKLEPNAPPPSARVDVIRDLIEKEIKCMVRVDPIIPGINEDPTELIKKLSKIGLKSVTSSTYKARPDSLKRMGLVFPEQKSFLDDLYTKNSEFINRARYMSREKRYELMSRVKDIVTEYGMEFSLCREGFPELQTAKSCDGSHLFS
jgi:DNA repair photolyase